MPPMAELTQAYHFQLYRRVDHSGVSGTGVVADGVRFASNMVAVGWRGDKYSVGVYPNMDHMLAVHGHGGDTTVVWLHERPSDFARWEVPPMCGDDGDDWGRGVA
jgi:hypothetical protein